jgi:hypothetical protein
MRAEIKEQPAGWNRLLDEGQDAVARAAAAFRAADPTQVVLLPSSGLPIRPRSSSWPVVPVTTRPFTGST